MAELNFKKLADAPILEEVPDGAKVYAEVDGKVYRVAGDNLGGGGIPTAIIWVDAGSAESASVMTLAAGDGARANVTKEYPCTVENMTFEEAEAILSAGKPLGVVVVANTGEAAATWQALSVMYVPGSEQELASDTTEAMIITTTNNLEIGWTPSGCTAFFG